jgi:hypothetical protein
MFHENEYRRDKSGKFSKVHKFDKLGIAFLISLGAMLMYLAVIAATRVELISPLSGIEMAVEPVVAKETVKISCEDPAGYLECQVYQGKISWKDHEKLDKIAMCESRYNENAINVNKNGSVDRGVFQINSVHKGLTNVDAFNFKKNIDFAIEMYKKQGVRPWVCARLLGIK